ncbi:MAG: glycerate kinase type-2 family protein [Pirellulales bacterium]
MPEFRLPTSDLRRDALRIWHAGVDAVRSERLVAAAVRVQGNDLHLAGEAVPLDAIGRIAVVGAGKAGAGMAAAVEEALGPELTERKQLTGWVNVPGDCLRALRRIHLHAARPAGVNEPRPEGVHGVRQILRLAESLGPQDLCLCLISGGGSALLPLPVEGISLDDKLAVTRRLSAAGAEIGELNTVRKQLSRIKGGGLARACRAGRLVALIISDVLGDPLDVIASGPTVADDRSTPAAALEVLHRYAAGEHGVPESVFRYLRSREGAAAPPPTCRVSNHIIGNNATAVDAAGREAERLGYNPAMLSSTEPEGLAEEVGRRLAETALRMRDRLGRKSEVGNRKSGAGGRAGVDEQGATGVSPVPGTHGTVPVGLGESNIQHPTSNVQHPTSGLPNCLITGGEPVVRLAEPSRRGLGGRNQQLVLAALQRLQNRGGADRIALLSGGTDGEDGPTDAAGAVLDALLLHAAEQQRLDPTDYLERNDAYHFFQPLDGLIQTGPTGTNVCDIRVVVVGGS